MKDRRGFLQTSAIGGAALIVAACHKGAGQQPDEEDEKGGNVTATEDLMREHGVLRRALLVYAESVPKLRADASSVSPDALQRTARLFRTFGEDYHEQKLEEAYIFPAVKNGGGAAAALPDILVTQHNRGREITEYILSVTSGAKLGAANEALAQALVGFVRMYEHHAALEDTIIFPAWKATLNEDQMDEIGDKFEEIEQKQFGQDGYEDAVKQINDIEQALGLSELSQFTAPPPPVNQPQPSEKK
ncbi:MAG TPA: hemerythrin domain-containing protein [Pyrinomonadaceae bacterium]|nr:hemerythrin domain-containing protein [Pyrinomonadaceae bacterium]